MGKIVIYTTSMTAVRSTTDACSYVKKVFLNRGIPFEERDVFIHKEHQKELQKRLGKHLTVPQVIINGNHVGVCLNCFLVVSSFNLAFPSN